MTKVFAHIFRALNLVFPSHCFMVVDTKKRFFWFNFFGIKLMYSELPIDLFIALNKKV
jgi:hypothetical protein